MDALILEREVIEDVLVIFQTSVGRIENIIQIIQPDLAKADPDAKKCGE
jgi:hypothetical protein